MTKVNTKTRKFVDSRDKPWFKVYIPGEGPIINGSELRSTSSTSRRAFKEPEARP